MTGPQLDDLWSLIQRRWPSATAAKAPEVITEWSASLERLEYSDAMAAVVRLSEEETWFPQTVAPIMARAAEERAQRARDQATAPRPTSDFNLTARWIAEVQDYRRRYGTDDEWMAAQMRDINHAADMGRCAEQAYRGGPAARQTFKRQIAEAMSRSMDPEAPPASPDPPDVPMGGKDRAAGDAA